MSSLAHLMPADFARRHLRTGRELIRKRRQQPAENRLVTGVEPFDQLLGGGLLRGSLHELSGRRGGRFSLVLETLAAVTSAGEAAALVDLGDALDPQLAEQTGVVLERLLWVRPRKLKEALSSVEAILATAMPLVVLDLGLPPVPGGRGHEASWLRLARHAQDQRVALLVSSPYRVSGTTAQTVIELQAQRVSWQGHGVGPRLLERLRGRLELVKGENAHESTPKSLVWGASSPIAPAPAASAPAASAPAASAAAPAPANPQTSPSKPVTPKPTTPPRPRHGADVRRSPLRAIA